MRDPTYVLSEIEANPIWKLAFWMSEVDNDQAPLGWARYISLAGFLLEKYDVVPKEAAGTNART